MEYRMIDYDMFDEDMIHEINGLSKRGWKIIRVLDPMKWANSDGMFIRIFYERESQKAKTGTEQCNLPIVINRTYKCDRCGTVYIPVSGIVNAGCCTAPVTHRTSGLCGGQLTEITS